MSSVAIFLLYKIHMHYMWHKHAVNQLEAMSDEELTLIAEKNKRDFGFTKRYTPTLEISTKRKMYKELGGAVFEWFCIFCSFNICFCSKSKIITNSQTRQRK